MANQPKRFKAMLERGTEGLGWTIARLPFDPHKAWTKMQRLRVRGKVLCPKGPSIEFRTSLFPVPGESGHHLLLVNNRVQREARIGVGSVAGFLLEADLEPRPAELPPELASLLDEEPGLRDYYDSLSESMRREIGKWVMNVKSDASRMKRAEQMAGRLLGAMEGAALAAILSGLVLESDFEPVLFSDTRLALILQRIFDALTCPNEHEPV
jgi:hypothetical protein